MVVLVWACDKRFLWCFGRLKAKSEARNVFASLASSGLVDLAQYDDEGVVLSHGSSS